MTASFGERLPILPTLHCMILYADKYDYTYDLAEKVSLSPFLMPSPYDLYCVGGTLRLTQSINQSLSDENHYCIHHDVHVQSRVCLWKLLIHLSSN